ncbi:hypothetical protein ACFHWD_04200 [Clostridium sp. MT-14]|uniref:hypothetical protein n=1 Tax=Clostridium sp. MT-14 TaxID=3348360 RepID=UPI0035F306D3
MPNEKILKIKHKKWIERNSIKRNEGFISKILDSYRITYEITCNCYGDYDIFISYNLQRYKIEIDIEQMSYKLLIERDLINNPKHKNRFKFIKIFKGEDLIFDIIRYLDNINKHKNNVGKRII